MKLLISIIRIAAGLMFTFSGFVKLIDPFGFAYKFTDYFIALNLDFLNTVVLFLAIIICVTEFIIGLLLLLNVFPRLASWGFMFFMAVFIPLSLWVVITNPIKECGCYGDAINFTYMQLFYKNIVLFIFAVIIFIRRKKFKPYFNKFFQSIFLFLFFITGFGISIYSLNNLPVLDFRPYNIGANIIERMKIPESKADSYIKKRYQPTVQNFIISPIQTETNIVINDTLINLLEAEFIYEKNGEENSFKINQLPDTSWIFTKINYHKELNPEKIEFYYRNKSSDSIKEFIISELPDDTWIFAGAGYYIDSTVLKKQYAEGANITNMILPDDNYYFFVIMPEINKTKIRNIQKIKNIVQYCNENAYKIYCLTSSSKDEVENFIEKNDFYCNFYNMNSATLKTIVRSNPGLVLLKNGTILNKWSHKNIPEIKELDTDLAGYVLSEYNYKYKRNLIWIYLLVFIFIIYLIFNIQIWLIKNKFIQNR